MLDVSNRAVNENALGNASVRRAVRDHAAVAQRDGAGGQRASEGRVAQPDHDRIARVATRVDPRSDARRLRVAEVDEMNQRLVAEARLVEQTICDSAGARARGPRPARSRRTIAPHRRRE